MHVKVVKVGKILYVTIQFIVFFYDVQVFFLFSIFHNPARTSIPNVSLYWKTNVILIGLLKSSLKVSLKKNDLLK